MITSEDLYSDDFCENNLESVEVNDGIATSSKEQPQQDDENQTDGKIVKVKRIVRNPLPKLNENTLKGPKGLTAVPSYFERVRFKGKGNEEQDLNVLLKTYEYWCHRLFPKFPFDDCIAKIEKLGVKRGVQTHVKRIRMDIAVNEEPIINENDDAEQLVDNDNSFSQLPDPPTVGNISEDQEERIRLNRERAQRLRDEKLKAIQGNCSSQSLTSQISQDLFDNQVTEELQSEFTQEFANNHIESEQMLTNIQETDKSTENQPKNDEDDDEESIENILDQLNADDA